MVEISNSKTERPPSQSGSGHSFLRPRAEPPDFPERRDGQAELSDADYAELLRLFATRWVKFFVSYYDKRARRCRFGAIGIRFVAFAAMVLGGVILVARMLSSSNQKWIMQSVFHSDNAEVPAEIGLILFALAAGLMAADRFGNISENWMRYVIASLSLQRSLVGFQLAGVNSNQTQSAPPATNQNEHLITPAQMEFDRIKVFLNSVFDLVQHETQEWADEFRKNRSDLEGYLKVQDAAGKDAKVPK